MRQALRKRQSRPRGSPNRPTELELPLRERLREAPAVRLAARHPERTAVAVIGLFLLILIATKGLHDVAQTGLNGLSLGSVYALGAVGLTLVYGILKLVNFAHGDFLTFGAYMAFLVNVTWGVPLVSAIIFAIAMTALLGVFFERVDVAADAGAQGRAAPARPDVDRARVPDPLRHPVRLGHRDPEPRRQQRRHRRVPRASDRPHRADRDRWSGSPC